MCAQRMLRSGQSAEVIKSTGDRPPDPRQGTLDLDPATTTAEQLIYRLAYENAQLISRLACAGLPTGVEDPNDRDDTSLRRNSQPDPIAKLAASFAKQVEHLSSIQTDHPNGDDAAKVNASIEMIAEEADALVTAVIKDAEDHGLEATGPWLKIPLIETQAFEVQAPGPEADKADYEYDRRQNS